MKNMSAWAIRHPTLPIVLFMVLTFVGLVSFTRLPINLTPDLSFPLVLVSVSQPGAAPSEIETQITQKVEGAVRSVADVRNISSRAFEGGSVTSVEFQIGTPIDRALNDVRDAVSKIRADLPDGVDEPQVNRIEIEGGAIGWYAVSTTGRSPEQLSWYVDNTLSKRLLAIQGVAQVSRGGGVNREIRVELDPARMQALGLTASEVNQQLRVLNVNAPGGRAQVGGGEQSIRVLGAAATALELGATRIRLANGSNVRLQDIAEVSDAVGERRSLSRVNGRQATSFGVFKARGSSEVAVMDAIEAELAALAKESPDITVKRVFTTVEYTRETYRSALTAMIEGSILAVLVVFIFLRDWRATVISALAIPLSAIPTFAFMYWQEFTLNNISLLALSLVAGVLVDDAIVEIENIVRHMRMGKSGYQAALDAADEIGLAVVATSATIIAVFLPVSFMGGFSGQYFKQFGLTVAAAVFFSLLVARLITPLIAAYTLKPHDEIRSADGPLMNAYLDALRWSLQHRRATLIGGTLFFLFSIGLLVAVPKSLLPSQDFGSAQVDIELPPGVRLEQTAEISGKVRELLAKQPEVSDVIEEIGGGDVRTAQLYVTLVPRDQREMSQKVWQEGVTPLFAEIPDARVTFAGNDGPGGLPITLYLTGEDPAKLEATARRAIVAMRALPELRDPRINGDLQRPEILIRPRLDLAAELGVSVAAISQTIRIATLGDLPQNAAQFSAADRQIPIRVSLIEDSRRDLGTLENLPVRTAAGSTVPLKAVADISFGEGPSVIRRYNQSRRVVLESELAKGGRARVGARQGGRTRACARQSLCTVRDQESARGRASCRSGASRVSQRITRELHLCHRCGCAAGVRRARDPVRARVATDHHSLGFAAVGRWRGHRAHARRHAVLDAGGHRFLDAHGSCRQELDPAGRLRHRRNALGQATSRGAGRGRAQARAADHHDHGRDGGRHAARGFQHGGGRVQSTYGCRGDRRTHYLYAAHARDRAVDVFCGG